MGNILTESLEIVRPSLPPALVAPEAVARLWEAAQSLVPIPSLRVGLECRLGAGASQVDLQQGILAGAVEPALLADRVASSIESPERPLPPHAARMGAFCSAWRDPTSPLHAGITEVWLEFDIPGAAPAQLTPSVFIGLDRNVPRARETLVVAEAVMEILLGGPASLAVRRNLRHCLEVCPDGAVLSHVGVMLSRQVEALRVNIQRLPADEMVPYLERVGWPGPAGELLPLIARLCNFADTITLCLDVGAHISPRIGLECFLKGPPDPGPRWAAFLDRLTAWGLCTREKRDALLAWPSYTDPVSSTASWPSSLIAESLLQPPDRFSVLARRLSHVKVIYQPLHVIEAKAYFGFTHEWLLPDVAGKEETPAGDMSGTSRGAALPPGAQRNGAAHQTGAEGITTAIQRAIAFLLKARNQAGWWCDFPGRVGGSKEWLTAFGGSDEWVSAYVGAALAAASDPRARQAARHAWSLLQERRQPADGWGHNLRAPVDADSTAWGLRLAATVGAEKSERAQRARRVLGRHVLPNGGITTYRDEAWHCPVTNPKLRSVTGTYAGWCHTAHPCVTGAAAGIGDERPRDFLRRAQGNDGSWKAYWWEDREYTTALAAEALARTGRSTDRPHVQAAIRWAAHRIGPNGAAYSTAHAGDSAFVTAWCVSILALAADPLAVREPLERALGWLLAHQRLDGAWPASARLRAPAVDDVDPDRSVRPSLLCLDEAGIFTTATVLSALLAAQFCFNSLGLAIPTRSASAGSAPDLISAD